MLQTQKDFIEFLEFCQDIVKQTGIEAAMHPEYNQCTSFSEWLDILMKNVNETLLLVPVIGAFSAGKSSLLNAFLGKKYLSVGITPETALATELHYGEQEYIEAVKEDGQSIRFDVKDAEELKSRAKEFMYVKFYIHSQKLKALEPLVLVDMPGFESPYDAHNKAIFTYIQRGVHFVALQSVEDGNITKTMMRKLEEIDSCGRGISLFLSKSNLKNANEVEKIRSYVKEQLDDRFEDMSVGILDDKDTMNLQKILEEINPESLIKNIFTPSLKSIAFDLKQNINAKIATYSRSKEENQERLQEYVQALQKLEKEQEKLIAEARSNGDGHANRIINSVIWYLDSHANEIVQALFTQGNEAAEALINDLVRTALQKEIHVSIGDIAQDITKRLNYSLEHASKDICISDLGVDTQALGEGMQRVAASGVSALIKAGGIAGTIGGVLKFALPVLNPILMILVHVLPSLLIGLFAGNKQEQERNRRDEVRNKLISEVFPQLRSELNIQVPRILGEQTEEIIKAISEDFKDKLLQQKQTVEIAQKEIDANIHDMDEKMRVCKEALIKLESEANNILY